MQAKKQVINLQLKLTPCNYDNYDLSNLEP